MPTDLIERAMPRVSCPMRRCAGLPACRVACWRGSASNQGGGKSCVTDGTGYFVAIAPTGETVREHARQGGFPATCTFQIRTMIDPTMADR